MMTLDDLRGGPAVAAHYADPAKWQFSKRRRQRALDLVNAPHGITVNISIPSVWKFAHWLWHQVHGDA
jgi:hypothetical protein